jgi:hypothetical protein
MRTLAAVSMGGYYAMASREATGDGALGGFAFAAGGPDLIAVHVYVLWGLDADLHTAALDPEDGDVNVVADADALARLPAEYQHPCSFFQHPEPVRRSQLPPWRLYCIRALYLQST